MTDFVHIGKPCGKIDGISLATGREKFTNDFYIENPLYGAFLYSPVPHGEITGIELKEAMAVEGVAKIYHYENTPDRLFTTAGQGFPEPSPYDTRLFDSRVRFAGDRVAMVAAETEDAAKEAVKKIKVEYKELRALFDPEKAADPESPKIHAGNEYAKIPVPYLPEKNIAAIIEIGFGDTEKGFKEADFIEENTYKVHYASHAATEPHAVSVYFDERGRLVIITTTQVPFHVRRIISFVLDIPLRMIRVIKPRIGGGFGGKQEIILEPYGALIAWDTGRNVKIVLSREEVFQSTRTRHPMRIKLKTGFKKDGRITALSMDALMNNGAYGSHSLTVLSNTGSKVLPLFNKIENLSFAGKTVYTNLPVGGAYRGYGATQGYFALNQQIDIIARKTGQDILEYCKKWHIKEGETSAVFEALGEGKEGVSQTVKSCKLDSCIDMGAAEIEWYKKRGKRIKTEDGWITGVGLSIGMQGSGIPLIDMGSASMKMNEDGSFNLFAGATDIGTGSDTVLGQIVSEVLKIPLEKVLVLSSDTDLTPFDVGAYASSTTYVSGTAVKKCAEKILSQILDVASEMLETDKDDLKTEPEKIVSAKNGKNVSYSEISIYSLYQANQFQIQASASSVLPESPPPFIAQFAEVAVDIETGRIKPLKFVSAVDCGQPINTVLAEGQVEGAVVNGISYALTEEYIFNKRGKMVNPNFGNYKVYTAADIPEIKTIIAESYEPTGPFGAKSVGEIAINGPAPAIANAVFDAAGIRLYETPFTPEKVWRELIKQGIV